MALAKTSKDDAASLAGRQPDAAGYDAAGYDAAGYDAAGCDAAGNSAAGDADVRLEKVERLRAAIANGSYSVSAEALAERMIEHMREPDTWDETKDKS